jgi:hypothetical protein
VRVCGGCVCVHSRAEAQEIIHMDCGMVKFGTPFLPVGSPPAQHRLYYQQHS